MDPSATAINLTDQRENYEGGENDKDDDGYDKDLFKTSPRNNQMR